MRMKTMIPVDVRVILDLEQGAARDVDICTGVVRWNLWTHSRW